MALVAPYWLRHSSRHPAHRLIGDQEVCKGMGRRCAHAVHSLVHGPLRLRTRQETPRPFVIEEDTCTYPGLFLGRSPHRARLFFI